MMKSISLKSIAALVACSCCVFTSMAYDFEAGGLYYDRLGDNEACVVNPNGMNGGGYTGQIAIPATVVNDGVELRVTAIGDAAFYNCPGLTAVKMPSSIADLGNYTFYGSTDLLTVVISPRVTELPSFFCYSCSALTQVVIPDAVDKVGAWSFQDCTSLECVVIGSCVNWIGASAFSGCTALTSITCKGTTPAKTVSTTCFESSYHTATLYVPEDAIEAYRSTEYWSWFEFIEPIDDGILIGDVNDDKLVDVSDVVVLIDFLLKGSGVINVDNADVESDNWIDVNDVTSLIALIMGNE